MTNIRLADSYLRTATTRLTLSRAAIRSSDITTARRDATLALDCLRDAVWALDGDPQTEPEPRGETQARDITNAAPPSANQVAQPNAK